MRGAGPRTFAMLSLNRSGTASAACFSAVSITQFRLPITQPGTQ